MKNRFVILLLFLGLTVSGAVFAEPEVKGIVLSPPRVHNEDLLIERLKVVQASLAGSSIDIKTVAGQAGNINGYRGNFSNFSFNGSYSKLTLGPRTVESSTTTKLDDKGNLSSIDRTEKTSYSEERRKPEIPEGAARSNDIASGTAGIHAQDLLEAQLELEYLKASMEYMTDVTNIQGRAALVSFDISVEPSSKNKLMAAEVELIPIVRVKNQDSREAGEGEGSDGSAGEPEQQPQQQQQQQQQQQTMPAWKRIEAKTYAASPSKLTPPKVTVLQQFPRGKSYNVLQVTQDIKNIGLGIVLGPISFGGRSSNNNESAFVVKDNEVESYRKWSYDSNADVKQEVLGWRFRPIFRNDYVYPGIRRVYLLLDVPKDTETLAFETVTRWVEIGRKSRVPERTYIESSPASILQAILDNYEPPEKPDAPTFATTISSNALLDLGGGDVQMTVLGSFRDIKKVSLGAFDLENFSVREVGPPPENTKGTVLAQDRLICVAHRRFLSNPLNILFVQNASGSTAGSANETLGSLFGSEKLKRYSSKASPANLRGQVLSRSAGRASVRIEGDNLHEVVGVFAAGKRFDVPAGQASPITVQLDYDASAGPFKDKTIWATDVEGKLFRVDIVN